MQVNNANFGFKGIMGIKGTPDERMRLTIPLGQNLRERKDVSQGKVLFVPFTKKEISYYVYGNDLEKVTKLNLTADELANKSHKIYDANQVIKECEKTGKSLDDKTNEMINEVEKISNSK